MLEFRSCGSTSIPLVFPGCLLKPSAEGKEEKLHRVLLIRDLIAPKHSQSPQHVESQFPRVRINTSCPPTAKWQSFDRTI